MESTLKIKNSGSFAWLHVSDLHLGASNQARLMPRLKTVLADDLSNSLKRSGGIDAILFTGDLVQSGAHAEYEALDVVIDEILQVVERTSPRPPVIAIPGNHDLVRPSPSVSQLIALKNFWNHENVRDIIWREEGREYLDFIHAAFSGFSNWQSRAIDRGVHAMPLERGIMPGDASYEMVCGAISVGIVGLNSAWLQLDSDTYEAQLHVDALQLLRVTQSDPDKWAAARDIALLLTHHPSNWLRKDGLARWENEISPVGRFDLHLFGHMHEPVISSRSFGGSGSRKEVQAASLFGLEKFRGGIDRIHGYSANRITIDAAEKGFECWPRKVIKTVDGALKLVADQAHSLDEFTNSFKFKYEVRDTTRDQPDERESSRPGIRRASELIEQAELVGISGTFADYRSHRNVRKVEQDQAARALRDGRILWLSAEWGMGEEGFLAAACQAVEGIDKSRVFRLNVGEYVDQASFFDDVNARCGATFEQIILSFKADSLLILDEISFDSAGDAQTDAAAELEAVVKAAIEFSGNIFVVLKCARRPKIASCQVVTLGPLDEVDIAQYVADSHTGRADLLKFDSISKIFRLTDGIPKRIDEVLDDLEFLPLNELVLANSDHHAGAVRSLSVPFALARKIESLATSDESLQRRAHEMLLALAAMPYGEQLSRIRRFLGAHPLGPDHARLLIDGSLVTAVSSQSLAAYASDQEVRTLVVPRLVREHLREVVAHEKTNAVDRRALELYFGESWASGDISSAPIGQRVKEALCESYEIFNASAILVRSLNRAISQDAAREINALLRLINLYAELLSQGSHYRALTILSEDSLSAIRYVSNVESQRCILEYMYGCGLRMLGRIKKAREVLESIDKELLTKDFRLRAELQLALAMKLSDDDSGALAAQRVIDLKSDSGEALQAESLLAMKVKDLDERIRVLESILERATKRKMDVLVSNVNIEIARALKKQGKDPSNLFRQIVAFARAKGDFYNAARAVVSLSECVGGVGWLNESELDQLFKSYHFLHNERMFDLFNRCHAALWKYFDSKNDLENLLSLYRHSSFIWRLAKKESIELGYLKGLAARVGEALILGALRSGQDAAYLMVRISVVLKEPEALNEAKQGSECTLTGG